ncbi:hypothetical protein [Sphingomonas sp.]|uniref:hypothetical protein n=1 Tax=Sphingomonas sp. TaxID=28214 RepID=UPI00262E811A|nr:hypothetical protein [Sphingomonas sp.]MDF2603888.1 hypothetical protein [Sphingomonas sp.]
MTDNRSNDPLIDSLPEDEPEAAPDSPPAAQDDLARTEFEGQTAIRNEAIDEGAIAEPHDAPARFSETDSPDGSRHDPRVN